MRRQRPRQDQAAGGSTPPGACSYFRCFAFEVALSPGPNTTTPYKLSLAAYSVQPKSRKALDRDLRSSANENERRWRCAVKICSCDCCLTSQNDTDHCGLLRTATDLVGSLWDSPGSTAKELRPDMRRRSVYPARPISRCPARALDGANWSFQGVWWDVAGRASVVTDHLVKPVRPVRPGQTGQ